MKTIYGYRFAFKLRYCRVLEVSTSVTISLCLESGCYYIKDAVTSNFLLSLTSSFYLSLKYFCELRLKARTYRKSIERCHHQSTSCNLRGLVLSSLWLTKIILFQVVFIPGLKSTYKKLRECNSLLVI